MAAQEQALSTRAIELQSLQRCTRNYPTYRKKCKLVQWKWLGNCILHRRICATFGLEFPMSQWETPTKVVENKMRLRRISSSNWYWKEDRQTDRQKDRQTDRKTDRQADRQTDRQAGRQADRLLILPSSHRVRSEHWNNTGHRSVTRLTDNQSYLQLI